MSTPFIPVLLLDADGQLEAKLSPLCKANNVDLLPLRAMPRGYQNLRNLVSGFKFSVLLIDESFLEYIHGIGLIRLQQSFPDVEIMMFGTQKIDINPNDTFRYFKKPVDPEIVVLNIKLAARKNEVAKRKARALVILQEASVNILQKETENEVLKSMVDVACRIMDDSNRPGYFSHLALLTEDNCLIYRPEHHTEEVYELLQKSLNARVRTSSHDVDCPAIRLDGEKDGKIGIVGLVVRKQMTQRVDNVKIIQEFIILHASVNSQISVLIQHDHSIFGVLSVEYPDTNAFDENDQFAFEALASIIGVAIRQKRLAEREHKQSRALEVLAQTGEWAAEGIQLTRDQIFQKAVLQAGALMDVKDQGYLVHLAVLEGNKLVFSPLHHSSQVLIKINQKINGVIDLEHPLVIGDTPRRGIVGRAVQEGRIQNVGDVAKDPDYIPFSEGTRSQLAVPIRQSDKLVGAINIEHERRNVFDKLDEKNLNSLAQYIGIALSNADLFAQEATRAEQYESVYRAGQMISQHNELQAVLDELAEQALLIVGDDSRGIGFFSHVSLREDGYMLRIRSVNPTALPEIISGPNNAFRKEIDLQQPTKRGLSGLSLIRGMEINAGDVSQYEDYVEISPDTRSQLSVPIIQGSNLIGVIGIESSRLYRFSNEDVEKVKLIARMGAIAIENSRRIDLERDKSRRIRDLTLSVSFLALTVIISFILPYISNFLLSGNKAFYTVVDFLNTTVQLILAIGSLVATGWALLKRLRARDAAQAKLT